MSHGADSEFTTLHTECCLSSSRADNERAPGSFLSSMITEILRLNLFHLCSLLRPLSRISRRRLSMWDFTPPPTTANLGNWADEKLLKTRSRRRKQQKKVWCVSKDNEAIRHRNCILEWKLLAKRSLLGFEKLHFSLHPLQPSSYSLSGCVCNRQRVMEWKQKEMGNN